MCTVCAAARRQKVRTTANHTEPVERTPRATCLASHGLGKIRSAAKHKQHTIFGPLWRRPFKDATHKHWWWYPVPFSGIMATCWSHVWRERIFLCFIGALGQLPALTTQKETRTDFLALMGSSEVVWMIVEGTKAVSTSLVVSILRVSVPFESTSRPLTQVTGASTIWHPIYFTSSWNFIVDNWACAKSVWHQTFSLLCSSMQDAHTICKFTRTCTRNVNVKIAVMVGMWVDRHNGHSGRNTQCDKA